MAENVLDSNVRESELVFF